MLSWTALVVVGLCIGLLAWFALASGGSGRSRDFLPTPPSRSRPWSLRPNLVRQDESHDPRWRDDIDRNTKMVTAPVLESPAEEPVASLLLLGPSGAGKSTLFNAGLTLGGERLPETSAGPPPPTRGLVRQLLVMPASAAQGDWLQRLLLCDAGGGRAEQRQWIELVREPEVGALVFVADVADDSEETLQLFKQLASSKWAKKVTEGEEEGRERHRNVGR